MPTTRSSLAGLRHANSSNNDILTDDNSKDTGRAVSPSPHLENNSLLTDLESTEAEKTISVALGNLSGYFEISRTEESHSLTSGVLSNRTQSIKTNPSDISATVAEILHRKDDDDSTHKIMGIVLPFTCVILVAALLLLTWKMCNRYNRNNHKGLRKIAIFCDSCMTTQHVFQDTPNQRQNTSITLASSSYSFRSILSSTTSFTKTSSSLENNSHARLLRSPDNSTNAGRHSGSLSSPRQSPAGLRVEYIYSGRNKMSNSPGTPQNSGQYSGGNRGRPSYGRVSSQNSLLSRQTVGLGPSCRPGRSRRSVNSPLQPESLNV